MKIESLLVSAKSKMHQDRAILSLGDHDQWAHLSTTGHFFPRHTNKHQQVKQAVVGSQQEGSVEVHFGSWRGYVLGESPWSLSGLTIPQ